MSQDWAIPLSVDAFILPRMKAESASRKSVARARSTGARTRAAGGKTQHSDLALVADDEQTLRDCMEAICRHDQAALARFYDLTVGRVYGVALRIVRHADLVEEVVSDVYMQIWRDAHRYDDARGKILGWLLVIARSRALDLLRRQDEAFSHPDPYDLVSEPAAGKQNPQDLLEATRAGSAVHAAMLKLNPLQRQLLSLAFFRGLSHSEIVECSGIPLGSVKTHIRRALAVLRESLGPEFDGQW